MGEELVQGRTGHKRSLPPRTVPQRGERVAGDPLGRFVEGHHAAGEIEGHETAADVGDDGPMQRLEIPKIQAAPFQLLPGLSEPVSQMAAQDGDRQEGHRVN